MADEQKFNDVSADATEEKAVNKKEAFANFLLETYKQNIMRDITQDIERQFEERFAAAQETIDLLKQECQDKTEHLRALAADKATIEHKLIEAEESIDAAHESVQTLVDKQKTLEDEMERLAGEHQTQETLAETLQGLKTEKDVIQAQLENEHAQLDALKQKHDVLCTYNEMLGNDMSIKNEELTANVDELHQSHEQFLSLQEQVNQQNAQLASLIDEKMSLVASMEKEKSDKEVLERKAKDQDALIQELKNTAEKGNAADILLSAEEIVELQVRLDIAEKERMQAQAEITTKANLVAAEREKIEIVNGVLKNLTFEKTTLEETYAKQQAYAAKLELELENAQKTLITLKTQVKQQQSLPAEKQISVSATTEELVKIKKEMEVLLQARKEEQEMITAMLTSHRAESEKLKQEIESLKERT